MCPNENITLQFKNLVKVQSCFVKLQKCHPNFDIMFREIVIELLIQEISRKLKSGKVSRNLKRKVLQKYEDQILAANLVGTTPAKDIVF